MSSPSGSSNKSGETEESPKKTAFPGASKLSRGSDPTTKASPNKEKADVTPDHQVSASVGCSDDLKDIIKKSPSSDESIKSKKLDTTSEESEEKTKTEGANINTFNVQLTSGKPNPISADCVEKQMKNMDGSEKENEKDEADEEAKMKAERGQEEVRKKVEAVEAKLQNISNIATLSEKKESGKESEQESPKESSEESPKKSIMEKVADVFFSKDDKDEKK